MKTKLTVAVLACAILFVSGCGSSPQNQIIGKWEIAGDVPVKLTAEFTKDGTAKMGIFGQTAQGTYKLNGDELETTMNGMTTKAKVKFSGNEMELTSDGKTIKYKKM